MTVNRSGDLSIQYFIAYFKLVTLSRNYTLLQAKNYIFQTFFKGDEMYRGAVTKQRFEEAYHNLENGIAS